MPSDTVAWHYQSVNMQLRLPDEVRSRLEAAAEDDGQSVNTVAVVAIEDYLARQTTQPREFARMVAVRDAGLLARLAE